MRKPGRKAQTKDSKARVHAPPGWSRLEPAGVSCIRAWLRCYLSPMNLASMRAPGRITLGSDAAGSTVSRCGVCLAQPLTVTVAVAVT